MGLFSFAESPQLQALLADIVPTGVRDVAFALYFAAAFGVGQIWTILYGVVLNVTGPTSGVADHVRADGGVIHRRGRRHVPGPRSAACRVARSWRTTRAAIIRGPCETGALVGA